MAWFIATALDKVGLYRPLKKAYTYLADAQVRQRDREVRQDLRQTRHAIGGWAAQGAEQADPQRLFAILSFTNLPAPAKFHGLVAKAMQRRGYTPVIFTYSSCQFGHEYFQLFGIDRLVMWDQYLRRAGPPAEEVARIVATLLPPNPTIEQVTACTFHGVDVGKHALSMTSRRRIEGQLDLDDPETVGLFQEQLRQAVESVVAAERFFDEHPVEKMLVRDSGYTPNGGLYEVALARGIDCVVYEQGQRRSTWVLKRYTPASKGRHYFSLDKTTWEQVRREPWTAAHDARLDQEFARRYQPDSTDDTRRLQAGKALKTPEAVRAQLGLDPAKKTAVIFSHIAWDAAFFYGTCLFEGFEAWLYESVKFVAAECPALNWVVKLHPFNVFKLQREDATEESEMRLLRRLMPLPNHVKILRADTDINTRSLFPVVDYVLTVNGTVGMEFPCFGVPAVLAGTGRYNGYGFTIEPPTQEAYFETLRRLHTVPALASEQQQWAKQHLVTLMTRRQFSLEDIAPMELKRIHEAQSDVHDNLHILPRSLAEFEAASSIQRLGDWLAHSTEPDLLEPASWSPER